MPCLHVGTECECFYTHAEVRVDASCLPFPLLLSTLPRGRASQRISLSLWLGWLASKFPGSAWLCSAMLALQAAVPGFYVDARDLNLGLLLAKQVSILNDYSGTTSMPVRRLLTWLAASHGQVKSSNILGKLQTDINLAARYLFYVCMSMCTRSQVSLRHRASGGIHTPVSDSPALGL